MNHTRKKLDKLRNILRPDKADLLTKDLKKLDERIECIKKSCEKTSKKIEECSRCASKEGQEDSRMKKLPEWLLAQKMKECGKELTDCDEGSLLGKILVHAGDIEEKIGHQIIAYETTVEERILNPLYKIYKSDFQSVSKLKTQLTTVMKERDAAKTKYDQTVRHSTHGYNAKTNVKDEYEELEQKVDVVKTEFETEVCQFINKEPEISECILNYLRSQQEYYKKTLKILDSHIEEVEQEIKRIPRKLVFCTALEMHLESSNRSIALPIELCVCCLIKSGLDEEGLFRMAGSASKVKKLKAAFDAGIVNLEYLKEEACDPHVIANVLKSYLRELPEPLLMFDLRDDWIRAIEAKNQSDKLQEMWTVLQKLPENYYANLRYLVRFLAELSKQQEQNKMTPANIAIVIGPNILWARDSHSDNNHMVNMTATRLYSLLVEQFVMHVDYFFPPAAEDFEFFITYGEEEWHAGDPNHSLTSHPIIDPDDSSLPKRSQSNSSLEEPNNSPPHGSPKVITRRKNKPAPVPPMAAKTSTPSTNIQSSKSFNSSTVSPKSQAEADDQNQKRQSNRYGRISGDVNLPPPSPNQLNSRKGNEISSNPEDSTVVIKSVPPKPPQPNFMQTFGTKDVETKPNVLENFSAHGSSTLKHKLSFNSGSRPAGDDSLAQSKLSHGSSNVTTYSSLPRHYHTENSYKNQRTRPAAMGLPPPPAAPGLNTISTAQSQDMPGPKISPAKSLDGDDKPPKPVTDHVGVTEHDHSKISNIIIPERSVPSRIAEPSMDDNRNEDVAEAATTAAFIQSSSTDNNRPVPAPRSSLIQGIHGKEKETNTVPVVKERPTVMAKPRDLGKRWTASVHGDVAAAGDYSETKPNALTIHKSVDAAMENSFSHDSLGTNVKNGYLEDDGAPPKSPRTMFRPPRPQPPPPPKSKPESTDL